MPNDKARNTITRQWEMMKLLPSRGAGLTAAEITSELAELGYKVDKRTVERDLKSMTEIFPIHCNDAGQPYGWRWQDGAKTDLRGLTSAEALSLSMMEEAIKPLLPRMVLQGVEPMFRYAEQKLASMTENAQIARWQDKVRTIPPSMPLLPPKIDDNVLRTVQDSLLNEVQVEVAYLAMYDAEPRTRILHPLGLVQRGPVIYLVATGEEYDNTRLFAVHRIHSAVRLHDRVKVPKGFSLDHYIETGMMQFGTGKTLKLKAEIDPDLSRILRETPLSTDQQIVERDECHQLTATVSDSWQLRWWILSQGASIKIIAPKKLVSEIGQTIYDMGTLYRD